MQAFLQLRQAGLLSGCSAQAPHCSGFSCSGAGALGHPGFPGCSVWAQQCDAQAHGPVQQASTKKAQVRWSSCRDDMDLHKHQTTLSCQLARSSLPATASLLAMPISDSSWSSRECSLDLGGEHPPPFPMVMGAEAQHSLLLTSFTTITSSLSAVVSFTEAGGWTWIMFLVSSPGIELVGLF